LSSLDKLCIQTRNGYNNYNQWYDNIQSGLIVHGVMKIKQILSDRQIQNLEKN